jgi:hypothetical protein
MTTLLIYLSEDRKNIWRLRYNHRVDVQYEKLARDLCADARVRYWGHSTIKS